MKPYNLKYKSKMTEKQKLLEKATAAAGKAGYPELAELINTAERLRNTAAGIRIPGQAASLKEDLVDALNTAVTNGTLIIEVLSDGSLTIGEKELEILNKD